jgi:hypothetical protein
VDYALAPKYSDEKLTFQVKKSRPLSNDATNLVRSTPTNLGVGGRDREDEEGDINSSSSETAECDDKGDEMDFCAARVRAAERNPPSAAGRPANPLSPIEARDDILIHQELELMHDLQ